MDRRELLKQSCGMDLCATSHTVPWSILRSAFLRAGAGITIAIPVVLAIVRIVRSYLFGIEPYDPVTLMVAIILLTTVSMLAAWLPARHAAKINPMKALRYE